MACQASQGIQDGCKQLLLSPARVRHCDSNILLKDANRLGLLLIVTSDGSNSGKPMQHHEDDKRVAERSGQGMLVVTIN